MLTFLLFILIQITLIVCFFRYLKRKKKLSVIFCALFILMCCVFWLILHASGNGYSYDLSIDREKLKSFIVDLDTPEQYEEWFRPEKRFEFIDEEIIADMSKVIDFKDPYGSVHAALTCYANSQVAKEMYDSYFEREEKRKDMYPTVRRDEYTKKMLGADHEYYFTKTYASAKEDYLFLLLPDGDYMSTVGIRYKNVVFKFMEHSYQRKTRIDEVMDQLLADYERYKEEMSLPP